MRTLDDVPIGEDTDDLRAWVRALQGCPPVTHTLLASCRGPAHEEAPIWFFAEASAAGGVARLRCVACGGVTDVFDSGELWDYPPMHSCLTCAQSMVEVVIGLHADADADAAAPVVTWAVVATRCVTCGRIEGLTDLHVAGVPLEIVTASL